MEVATSPQPPSADAQVAHQEPRAWLRANRPPYEELRPQLALVDLFCGCGAMSLGVAHAAWRNGFGTDVRLAIDADPVATAVFSANFKSASVKTGLVEHHFDGELESPPTVKERQVQSTIGSVDVLLGGPPCQGHSNLNNHTRRSDSRNAVYVKMARGAEVLLPKMVLIENVPTVRYDVRQVVQATIDALAELGYSVDDRILDVSRLGVPQRRKRHVVLALRGGEADSSVILDRLVSISAPQTTVREAIEDLLEAQTQTVFDTASRPSDTNQARMDWLIAEGKFDLPNDRRPPCHASDHSYYAMYGRLQWDIPAQTITTGFNCTGQGRYVHPSLARTITPHEAARLQYLPDFWDMSAASTRKSLARLIGNAVPPPLSTAIVQEVFSSNPNFLQPAAKG